LHALRRRYYRFEQEEVVDQRFVIHCCKVGRKRLRGQLVLLHQGVVHHIIHPDGDLPSILIPACVLVYTIV
jgi:hypothetical protein